MAEHRTGIRAEWEAARAALGEGDGFQTWLRRHDEYAEVSRPPTG